jgi:murein L,D-transpeptidase YcbB/YkuD
MFPNDHAVYLHDTPQRNLFNASSRAFSSGCVRVENPFRLAELVLGGENAGWSQQRLRSLLGPAERTIRLAAPLPVHLTYMTVTVDDSGSVRRFEDIYGLHRRTREALGL